MYVLSLVSNVILPVSKPRYNLHCADFPKMRRIISDVDWENILNPLDLHDAWHYFSTVFDKTVAKSIPLDLLHPRKNIYMSHKALCLKNKKCNFWNRYIATGSVSTVSLILTVKLEMSYVT